MPLTLLQIVQDAAVLTGLDKPSSVVSSTHPTAVKALAMLHVEGANLRRDHSWDKLKRLCTITLVDGQQTYALPSDFERHVPSTHWDNRFGLEVMGPVNSADWQYVNNAQFVYTSSKVMRCWTWNNNQIYLSSTPDSTDAGSTITFEYQSLTWVRYRTWTASTAYSSGAKVWYNGNRYTWVSGTTSGSTAPTHTVGNASDGGVTWAYNSTELQERFEFDTDVPLIDDTALQLSLQAAIYEDLGQGEQAQIARGRAEKLASQTAKDLQGPTRFGLTDLGDSGGVFVSNNSVRLE